MNFLKRIDDVLSGYFKVAEQGVTPILHGMKFVLDFIVDLFWAIASLMAAVLVFPFWLIGSMVGKDGAPKLNDVLEQKESDDDTQ